MMMKGDIPQDSPTPSPTRKGDTGALQLHTAIARGIALFIAVFTLLNLMIGLRQPGYDANLWWINLGPLRRRIPFLADMALLFVAINWLGYAFMPMASPARRRTLRTSMELLMLFVGWNILGYYVGLARGLYRTMFGVPFSLFMAAAICFIWVSAGSERPRRGPTAWLVMLLSAGACAVLFPLLQMLCFGLTDYRPKADHPADVAVVFGARVFADGHASDAVADRVHAAADLYNKKLVGKLILTGGPAEGGAISETETMRRLAIDYGVKMKDIYLDPRGLNTDASVHNIEPILTRISDENEGRPVSVVAVSHFYHLPRIKMRFRVGDREVATVPVREPLNGTPKYMLREVAALWKYYFDALLRL